jgi:HEAT repeat protein
MSSASLSDAQAAMLDSSRPLSDRLTSIVLVSESGLDAEIKARALLSCLDDADTKIREMAIIGIGISNLKTEEILHRLIHVVYDGSGPVQCAAFRIYCRMCGPRSIDLAAHMLCHGTLEQRMAAIGALMSFGTPDACSLLELYWSSSTLEHDERVIVAMALAKYGIAIGEMILEKELTSSAELCMTVVSSLAFIGNQAGLLAARRVLLSDSELDRKWLAINLARLLRTKFIDGDYAAMLRWIETKIEERGLPLDKESNVRLH